METDRERQRETERLMGFAIGLMDRQTSGQTFAIVELLLRMKNFGITC